MQFHTGVAYSRNARSAGRLSSRVGLMRVTTESRHTCPSRAGSRRSQSATWPIYRARWASEWLQTAPMWPATGKLELQKIQAVPGFSGSSGDGIWTRDLRVMSPTNELPGRIHVNVLWPCCTM